MNLRPIPVPQWPKLAWLARWRQGSSEVTVRHGTAVETGTDWAAEAVWDGDFADGGFDRTDLVFGSGVRVRDGGLVFVPAATAMDRLWCCHRAGWWWVSNSLGALSAGADLSLDRGHPYADDRRSAIRTTWGVKDCVREFPISGGTANVAWFHNLHFDGQSMGQVPKPDSAGDFASYADYRDYLFAAARRLGANATSPERAHRVGLLASVSSGYDSPAAAVVAREAGCRTAVTFRKATSFWRGEDSGHAIAERIGMDCASYRRTAASYDNEVAFWAASGYANLLNWCLFDYPQPVSLFFIGCYGDAIWPRKKLADPFTIEVWDDLAMGEWRLSAGMIQCPVPFWGMRHHRQIEAITFSDEMAPWSIGGPYDRPIARRLVEETGVPRGSFALMKKNTSHEVAFRWPFSPDAQRSLRAWLRNQHLPAPGRLSVGLVRRFAHASNLLHANVLRKLGVRRRWRPWENMAGIRLLMHWANDELKQRYRRGLDSLPAKTEITDACAVHA